MNRRGLELIACCAAVACIGCSQERSPPAAKDPSAAEKPSDQGTLNNRVAESQPLEPEESSAPEPSADYSHASVPEATDKCAIEERDPAERPKNLVPANFRSNVIFYQEPRGSLWGHVYADGRAVAELRKGELIVAARLNKPDLWIRPLVDGVTLEAGPYRLACYTAEAG